MCAEGGGDVVCVLREMYKIGQFVNCQPHWALCTLPVTCTRGTQAVSQQSNRALFSNQFRILVLGMVYEESRDSVEMFLVGTSTSLNHIFSAH